MREGGGRRTRKEWIEEREGESLGRRDRDEMVGKEGGRRAREEKKEEREVSDLLCSVTSRIKTFSWPA